MFVAVYQEGTVTGAAQSLNLTQSTVSHGLNRLRAITGDELFVPMGRGITPTEKAHMLVERAREILLGMEGFARQGAYNPQTDERPFRIAASDYEIEIIVKPLTALLRTQAPDVRLEVMRARAQDEWVDLLRSGKTDLVLSLEITSDSTEVIQQRLLSDDTDICFFDALHREPPDTLDRYLEAHHVIMSPGAFRRTTIDKTLTGLGEKRHIALSVPSFSAVATMLRGTDYVAVMPERLSDTIFRDLANCLPPFEQPRDTIAQSWHVRSTKSPRHTWFRQQVRAAAKSSES